MIVYELERETMVRQRTKLRTRTSSAAEKGTTTDIGSRQVVD
jgi:hypothetical protein